VEAHHLDQKVGRDVLVLFFGLFADCFCFPQVKGVEHEKNDIQSESEV
jgi:hypothetical protein